MPTIRGVCRLCQEPNRDLRLSHFMPAALYGKRLEYATTSATGLLQGGDDLKDHLLCGDCERRFNTQGESHVLFLLDPNGEKGAPFPLLTTLQSKTPLGTWDEMTVYSGATGRIKTAQVAYFALSILWRAAVHRWRLPEGGFLEPWDIGEHQEPTRLFLVGKGPFPAAVVMMTLCTDALSREHWTVPAFSMEGDCLTFAFMVRGLNLRIVLGTNIPVKYQRQCCATSASMAIAMTHCEDLFPRMLEGLKPFGTPEVM